MQRGGTHREKRARLMFSLIFPFWPRILSRISNGAACQASTVFVLGQFPSHCLFFLTLKVLAVLVGYCVEYPPPWVCLLFLSVIRLDCESCERVPWRCSACFFRYILLLFSRTDGSKSLRPRGLQHTRLLCPSPFPLVCLSSCPLHQWCCPAISCSIVPFSSCPQSFPASGSSPRSRLFASGDQNAGTSGVASVLPMNIQRWFPLRLTGLISSLSEGLSRVFSSTTVQRHRFFSTLSSLQPNSHNRTWPWKRLCGPLSAKWRLCFSIRCLGLS